MLRVGGCSVVVRRRHFMAMVTFLIGCAFLLVVGCAETRSEAPQEKQGHTEASNEQGRSSEATPEEPVRCEGTRTIKVTMPTPSRLPDQSVVVTTNDVPGCPKGGPLSGTDKPDKLDGRDGDDEIHGLGGPDFILGGEGNDVIYAGPGDDGRLNAGKGEDVYYGKGGSDFISARGDRHPDKLYCGKGKDEYFADKIDYVDSSCELNMAGRAAA
jgi:RTX calcium-binding nonapeptide repeat (4 copies)